MGLWRKTRKCSDASYLTKSDQPVKATLYVPEEDLAYTSPTSEQVTVTCALLTFLDFGFSKNRSTVFNHSPSPKSLNSMSQAQTECKQIWTVLQQISYSTATLFSKILSRHSFLCNQMLRGHTSNSQH